MGFLVYGFSDQKMYFILTRWLKIVNEGSLLMLVNEGLLLMIVKNLKQSI